MKKMLTFVAVFMLAAFAMGGNTWQLTINLSTKTVIDTNTIAVRETVPVQLVHIGGSNPTNLIIQLTDRTGMVMAVTRAVATTNSDYAAGYLDLNTVPMVAVFSNLPPLAQKAFQLAVWDDGLFRLLVNDVVTIQNNIYTNGIASPSPAETNYWSTFIAASLTNETINRIYGDAVNSNMTVAYSLALSNMMLTINAAVSNLVISNSVAISNLTVALAATSNAIPTNAAQIGGLTNLTASMIAAAGGLTNAAAFISATNATPATNAVVVGVNTNVDGTVSNVVTTNLFYWQKQ